MQCWTDSFVRAALHHRDGVTDVEGESAWDEEEEEEEEEE